MKISKFLLVSTLVLALFVAQVGVVFAAPALEEALITGTVTALACDTDSTSGVTTFLVTVEGADGTSQTVRIDQGTALGLGLITVDGSGIPDCSEAALSTAIGMEVEIDPATVIPDEEEAQHPVASALALFFADVTDYETIMAAHEEGFGFGVIAQALWLTTKLEGDADTLMLILLAKKSGDYSAFVLEDGSTPQNWGQFRKAVLSGDKKDGLGVVMSGRGEGQGQGNPGQGNGGGNGQGNGNGHGNNGNPGQGQGHGQGNGGGNGQGNGNGNDQ